MLLQSLILAVIFALSSCHKVNGQYHAFGGVQDNVNSKTGQRPLRVETDTLQKDPYAWSLWIQSLNAFQKDRTNYNGYLDIAGIHGRPYIPWDNVVGPGGFTDPNIGYCTHDSILFPTWHRPYLAFFEDRINAYAITIAYSWKGRNYAKWRAAAHNLRLPYWDWASNANLPISCTTPTITIKTFTGSLTIPNPLFAYNMTSNFPASNFPDLPPYPTTVRCPDWRIGSEVSDMATVDKNMNATPLRSMIYNVLSQDLNYTSFATQANYGGSLEAIHGSVHVNIGGDAGHMSYLSYAAYDPIFWLHHCNVDRMFAIWQAVWPQKWFPNDQAQDSQSADTFTIQSGPGHYDSSSEGLTPFSYSSSGAPWTSDLCRTTRKLGYAYAETIDWGIPPAQMSANARASVNKLYGPSSVSKKLKRAAPPNQKQYYVSIAVDKYALPTGLLVSIFLGAPPPDPSTWRHAPNLAGSLPVLKPPPRRYPSKSYLVHGEVPLDTGLDAAGLAAAAPDVVLAYLVKNLCWRIQGADAAVVSAAGLRGLRVQVFDREVRLPDSETGFPRYGPPVFHPEVTRGKAGGY